MSDTTVPAALTALDKMANGVLSSRVIIGPPTQAMPADYMAIGWSRVDVDAVTLVQQIGSAGLTTNPETYIVTSEAVSWRGSPDEYLAAVAAAYAQVNKLRAALVADPHLGGAVELATFGSSALRPFETDKGPVAVVAFTIQIRAFV